MSRSIHDTRRFLFEAINDDFADPELQEELIRTARTNLEKQRSIKEHSRQQRRRKAVQLPPFDPHGVPISIRDAGPSAHHMVTEEDLRALMRRLPPGSLDGLQAIELCLRSDEHIGPNRMASGAYARESQTIRIFAQVDEGDAPGVLSIVLKLYALYAFLQQAAHHFDHMFRVGGSRWRMDDRSKNDVYAAHISFVHVVLHVIPYLQERYPAECAALAAWLKEHGGVALPLVAFVVQRRGRGVRALRALRTLMSAVRAGVAQADTRTSFAQALQQAGYRDYALAAIARVLAEDPAHAGALSVRAASELKARPDPNRSA